MGIWSHILSRTDQQYDRRIRVVGLQTLIQYPKPGMTTSRNKNIVHWWYNKKRENVGFISSSSAAVVVPVPVPSSSSSSSKLFTKLGSCMMGDMIGTESGDYIMSPIVSFSQLSTIIRSSSSSISNKRSARRSEKKTMRDYPPPISSLEIQTAYNGHDTVKMLWVFKREICREGTNGRLVVKAKRVEPEEKDFLESHRENGRLLMKLRHSSVAPDDAVSEEEIEEQVEDDNGVEEIDDEEDDNGEEIIDEEEEEEEEEGNSPWLSERNCVGLGNHGDGPNGFLAQPASAPLRPMTTVM